MNYEQHVTIHGTPGRRMRFLLWLSRTFRWGYTFTIWKTD